jgi:hypothetical protein
MRGEGEIFSVPLAGNGSRDSKWWPPSLSHIFLESWGNTGGQRHQLWVSQQGGIIQAYPNHRDKRCALEQATGQRSGGSKFETSQRQNRPYLKKVKHKIGLLEWFKW